MLSVNITFELIEMFANSNIFSVEFCITILLTDLLVLVDVNNLGITMFES